MYFLWLWYNAKSNYNKDHMAHKAWLFKKKYVKYYPNECFMSNEISTLSFGNRHYLALCCYSFGLK